MKTTVEAQSLMTPLPVRLNVTGTLEKAAMMMTEYKVRHLPVVDECKVIGMVALADLMASPAVEWPSLQVKSIMTTPAICVGEFEYLENIVPYFVKDRLHAVPVINHKEELVGIISTVDLIDWLYDSYKNQHYAQRNSQNQSV